MHRGYAMSSWTIKMGGPLKSLGLCLHTHSGCVHVLMAHQDEWTSEVPGARSSSHTPCHAFVYDANCAPPFLGGGILVIESLLDEDRRGPLLTQLYSLNMLVQTEGQERTPSHYHALLSSAGFRDFQFKKTGHLRWHFSQEITFLVIWNDHLLGKGLDVCVMGCILSTEKWWQEMLCVPRQKTVQGVLGD
ncbi:hypothetical protein P7K49_039792 [Saguinus oedipus]|uniref:O-methyltransferase C-terminal domain-containing protein n=1 Tax=Saguinus oedipus TaxID=9490 RepID=A0ABQ9TC58_SAGOE|nr:hypothetical protein P7K49_039792 [Saguinus oedipus]